MFTLQEPVDLPLTRNSTVTWRVILWSNLPLKASKQPAFEGRLLKAVFCNGVSLVGNDIKSLREFDSKFCVDT
jgi:hypothetical protein